MGLQKLNADGPIKCYKAHFVAKGYSQQEAIDFHKIYARVVKLVTV